MRRIARTTLAAAVLALSACARSYQVPLPPGPGGLAPKTELSARVRSTQKLAVLFVGNSYTFGVPKAFAKLAASHGKDVRTGRAATSGWTLANHAASAETLGQIRNGHWDVIVFQEHSQIPALPAGKRAAAMFPPLRQLVTEARRAGAVPVLYQTWGRRDGDRHRSNDDFHAMTRRLRAGYQAAAWNAGGLVVVPAGDRWEREFAKAPGASLFMPDGSHPAARGNEVTAQAFYEAFYGK